MTTVQDPPAGTQARPSAGPPAEEMQAHAVVRFADALSGALDRLAGVPAWSMTPDEQRRALVRLRRERARLEELELRVLASADRNEVGADSGATSTAAWLAHTTRATRPSCSRDVTLAEALDTDFDATRLALAAGDVNTEQARVIVQAVRALTDEHDELPPGTHQRAEAHLLHLALKFDATALRILGKRLFEVVCPEAADAAEGRRLEDEERRARARAMFSMRDNGDGTADGRFRLPSLHAGLLKKALEALTSPRRLGEGRIDPETGRKLPYPHLLGLGLIDLLEHHLDTASLPGNGGNPFTVVVNVDLEALRTGTGVAVCDTGTRISAAEARRLACAAGIIPMVLGGSSVPLDLGRERRLFSKHQRIALAHRYGGCAADNCDRPPSWTEIHHLDPWHRGGRTDLGDGLPLCPHHHRMADDPAGYDMRRLPSGAVRFTRRQ